MHSTLLDVGLPRGGLTHVIWRAPLPELMVTGVKCPSTLYSRIITMVVDHGSELVDL